jgi:hypothetical protein
LNAFSKRANWFCRHIFVVTARCFCFNILPPLQPEVGCTLSIARIDA